MLLSSCVVILPVGQAFPTSVAPQDPQGPGREGAGARCHWFLLLDLQLLKQEGLGWGPRTVPFLITRKRSAVYHRDRAPAVPPGQPVNQECSLPELAGRAAPLSPLPRGRSTPGIEHYYMSFLTFLFGCHPVAFQGQDFGKGHLAASRVQRGHGVKGKEPHSFQGPSCGL